MKAIKAKAPFDVPVTEAVLDEAIERGQARRNCGVNATTVKFQEQCLSIGFEDGSRILLPIKNYPEFDDFKVEDFASLEVGFAGTAICHEARGLQVSIAGLISASKPLMDMAAVVIASRNGRLRSDAKA
jgi:hypothetical protein